MKHMKHMKHNELERHILAGLPQALEAPMLVYRSPRERTSHAIVTSVATPQDPVTVYLQARDRENMAVLEVKTVFGKDPNQLLGEVREADNLGLVTHKNKAAFDDWLAQGDGAANSASIQHGQAIEDLNDLLDQSAESQDGWDGATRTHVKGSEGSETPSPQASSGRSPSIPRVTYCRTSLSTSHASLAAG